MFHFAWRLASRILPANEDLVIIATFPDFDDTARAVREALVGSRYRVVFIVSGPTQPPKWVDTAADRVLSRRSLRAVVAFHRAKWVVITHGLYSELPRTGRQFFINLWHGMPIKKIGTMLDEELPHTDIVLAENSVYREVMSEALDVKPEQVLVAPNPRVDIMLNVSHDARNHIFGDRWMLLALPTFRNRKGSKGRRDGAPEQSILHQIHLFQEFHECLRALDAVCVIKPHPLEDISGISMDLPDTVQILTDSDLDKRALSLYQLIGMSDALITDVSSVFFDYRRLGRPIFCFFPDFEAYESGRGFVRPFRTLVDVPILRTEAELIDHVLLSFEGRVRSDASPSKHGAERSALARNLLQQCGLEIH